jgi:diguanylate cyclase (GGDEF)-like protein
MNDHAFGRVGNGRVSEPVRGRARADNPAAGAGVRRSAPGALDALVRAALDSARPGLIVMDTSLTVQLITKGAIELLGIMPDDAAIARPVMSLLARSQSLDPAALQAVATAFLMSGDREERQVLVSVPAAQGSRVIAMDVRPAGSLGWVASLEDVTQSRQTRDWLVEHASSDPVTGLWNRQHLMLMLQDLLEESGRLTEGQEGTVMLLVALVRPKALKDSLGLTAADSLLRVAASRLSTLLREGDLLARFPAEEFAVVLPGDCGQASAAAMAERIVESLSRPYVLDGHMVTIHAQVGIARAPQDASTPETLVAAAALALANASANTLVRFFEPTLHETARRRRHLEHDLSRALAAEEFELWYQPQIDLSRHCIRVFEALIRWRSPSRGLVPPAEFIPLCEETGLIVPLGDWVLQRACMEAATWPDDIAVAVNASALQFETGKFGRSVARALAASGLPARRLEIEVTESLLLHDQASVEDTIHVLRELGVHLVLDDFGTGYASLSQLSRFHFDKIKIDRSFISPMPGTRPNHGAIVRSIAALGASLGIPTTAEGVETVAQLERVRADGCTCVQGYYFSKPVPSDGIAPVLQRLHHAVPANDGLIPTRIKHDSRASPSPCVGEGRGEGSLD